MLFSVGVIWGGMEGWLFRMGDSVYGKKRRKAKSAAKSEKREGWSVRCWGGSIDEGWNKGVWGSQGRGKCGWCAATEIEGCRLL